MSYFSASGKGPCWFCEHFDGLHFRASYALCSHPGCCRVRTGPETGCSAFSRAPGLDLPDDWAPVEWLESQRVQAEIKARLDAAYYARGREMLVATREPDDDD